MWFNYYATSIEKDQDFPINSAYSRERYGIIMSKINSTRSGCKDVFHAFLVQNAKYDGYLEFPRLNLETAIPNKLIPFSKAIRSIDTDAWVHFYEDDVAFERLWNQPHKYLPILKKFNGVISPDFSVYRDMPLAMQYWNIYRSRALAHWFQENGICVIPNIRFGDHRTYLPVCYGIKKHGVIAVGAHGCIKLREERSFFQAGLRSVVTELKPSAIIIYGAAPDTLFDEYRKEGIQIIPFYSEFMLSRKAVGA